MPPRNISMLLQDEQGATAVEYGLIVAMVVIVVVTVLQGVADETIALWSEVEEKVTAVDEG